MNATADDKAGFALSKALTVMQRQLMAHSYPWASETSRWHELVFALLTRVTDQPQRRVRHLVAQLGGLGFRGRSALDISGLAEIPKVGQAADPNDEQARVISQFLEEEGGFSPEQARRGVAAICDAARGLQKHYEGKVQRYLRHYGELMLKEIGKTFRFRSLTDAEVADAFTFWLQNALCMPLSLIDENVKEFCTRHGLEPEQLIAAADDRDFNLALVDDLTGHYVHTRGREAGPGRRQKKAPVGEREVAHA